MKRIFFAGALLLSAATAVQAQPAIPHADPKAPQFKFEETVHDFGTIPEGPEAGLR